VSLDQLLAEPGVFQIHAFAAMAAFLLGTVQFVGPKGTIPHRSVGVIWVLLMLTVAISSFWIHDLRVWGPWSPIHLLSIFSLIMLPLGVTYARRHNVVGHKSTMLGIFAGALIIAGIFALAPGRIMHRVVFGG